MKKSQTKRKPVLAPMPYSIPPARVWEETFRCGCGECRFKRVKQCPRADSPQAIMLYASSPR
jgi:hypothetical protein